MASSPLQSIELLDCARSDPYQDRAIATQRCGYGDDQVMFEEELKKAAAAIGVDIQSFEDWQAIARTDFTAGVSVAPNNSTQF